MWFAGLIEHHQLVGVLHRQLPQQDLVDQRENRGVGADAKGQREDGDGGEQRIAAQAADREFQIGEEVAHGVLGRENRRGG